MIQILFFLTTIMDVAMNYLIKLKDLMHRFFDAHKMSGLQH